MKCIALDDEPLALNVIEGFCASVGYLDFVAKCTSSVEAIELLNRYEIDLVFVDIQMPHITGLEFIKSLSKLPMVIFTTAYSEYALEGYDLSAVDYLVKPIPFPRFLKAVNKAYELYMLRKPEPRSNAMLEAPDEQAVLLPSGTQQANKYMLVRVDGKTIKVDFERIKYVEGLKDYIRIVVEGQKSMLTKSTMKKIAERLPETAFHRVHKSYIIAVDKIESLENHRIVMDDKYIPVGDYYKDDFYRFLDQFKL